MGDGKAFLYNLLLKKFGIVPEPQYGQTNPTFPPGHPRYGQPMKNYLGEPASLSPMQRNTLELRRNYFYDKPGLQMYPGYDSYIDELMLQEKYGPASQAPSSDIPALSPMGAEALAGMDYMNRGRTPDFNPAAADMYVRQRAGELMRG